jgi:hypothetical protein
MDVEVLEEEDIPGEHPGLVHRSQYNFVRALLAVMTIAVLALSVAVVVLADTGGEASGMTSADPIQSIDYGGFNPGTGRPESAPLPP